MFESLDDPSPPVPGTAAYRAVAARARARRRRRRRIAGAALAALTVAVAIGVPLALTSVVPTGPAGGAQETAYAFNLRQGPLPGGTPVPTAALVDVVFVSPYRGFGLAVHRGSLLLAASTDGGSRWSVVDARLPLGGEGAAQAGGAQVEFTDARHGYLWQPGAAAARGSHLWVTSDGGRQWVAAPIGDGVADVSAIGPNVWALVWPSAGSGASGGAGASGESGGAPGAAGASGGGPGAVRLEISTDAGRSWKASASPLPLLGLPAGAAGAGSGPGGVELARITTSWAYVLGVEGSANGPPAGKLVFTSDAGASWQERVLPCAAPYGAGAELAASSGADLWMFCASQADAGYQAKALYRSSDGGTSWTQVLATPYPPGRSSAERAGGGAGVSAAVVGVGYIALLDPGHENLAVLTPRQAWLMPARGSVLVTTDGGSRWRAVPDLSSAGFGAGAPGNVTFVSPTLGWACEYGVGLWRTSNGVTWSALGA